MKRTNHTNTMKAINEMEQALKKNRISLNETFNLPDYGYGEDDNYNMDESEDEEVPMDNAPQVEENKGNSGVEDILKQIRILSLKGITQLAENPEDPNYDILKKIWVIVDKNTVEKAKEGSELK